MALAKVAETRSFSRAAAALGLSPSTLSHAMRELEARLGARLLWPHHPKRHVVAMVPVCIRRGPTGALWFFKLLLTDRR